MARFSRVGGAVLSEHKPQFTTTVLQPLPIGVGDGSKWGRCRTTRATQDTRSPTTGSSTWPVGTPNPSVGTGLRCRSTHQGLDGAHLPHWTHLTGLVPTVVLLPLANMYSSSEVGTLPQSTHQRVAKTAMKVQS